LDGVVDDGELDVGELLGDLAERAGVCEADRDDRVEAAAGEQPQPLLLLRVGLARGRRQLARLGEVQLRLRPVEAGRRRVVERLVTAAAHVVGEANLQVRTLGCAARSGRSAALLASATGGGPHGDEGTREYGGAQSANSIAEQGGLPQCRTNIAQRKLRRATLHGR